MLEGAPRYQERLVADPDLLSGKPAVKGTRVAVEHVLEALADTLNLDELFAAYPRLTVADVQACLEYARAVLAGEEAALERAPRTPEEIAPAPPIR